MKNSKPKKLSSLFSALKDVKKYIPIIVVAMILLVVYVVLAILSPLVMRDLTNTMMLGSFTKNIDLKEVNKYCITLIIMYVTYAICGFVSDVIMTVVSQQYAKSMRTKIVRKLNVVKLSYFDNSQTGDIMSRLTNDVDNISQTLSQTLATVIHSVFQLVGVIVIMFVISWPLALVCFGSLPFIFITLLFIVKLSQPIFARRVKLNDEIAAVAEENYNGQIVIKMFSAEEKMKGKFNKVNTDLASTLFKSETCGGLENPITNLVSYIAYAGIFLVGGLLMANGSKAMSIGTISAFLMYINLFQSPLTQLAQSLNVIQTASASAGRVSEFLSQESIEDDKDKQIQLTPEKIKGKIEFNHVNFSYDDTREIIKDFSAKIEPGMKVAIVGPTGAGKTTMVNLLERFYEIDSGSITIDGVNIKDMSYHELHDLFSMVLQDTWIFEGTLRENLAYNNLNLNDDEIYAKVKEAHLVHFVRFLPNHLDYKITEDSAISGGQKQLITIARAMLKDSPFVILDEATSNVDTRTEEKVQESMDRLTSEKTSFVIAHRLSTIKNADLILVMRDGNIVEQGTHDSLMKEDGFYASLYNSQFKIDSEEI